MNRRDRQRTADENQRKTEIQAKRAAEQKQKEEQKTGWGNAMRREKEGGEAREDANRKRQGEVEETKKKRASEKVEEENNQTDKGEKRAPPIMQGAGKGQGKDQKQAEGKKGENGAQGGRKNSTIEE